MAENEENNWKEDVRRRLSRAASDASLTAIAENLQIKRQRLYDFQSKGFLNSNELQKVDRWLTANGYPAALGEPEEGAFYSITTSDPVERAALWLENLAATMRSPDEKVSSKAQVLKSSLEYLLAEVVPRIKEAGES